MVEREIKKIKKDELGNIFAICNPGEWWSPKSIYEAIMEIEESLYGYYVLVNEQRVDLNVVNDPKGKYLRTDPDKTINNNLDELPAC